MALANTCDSATISNQYKVIFENSPLGILYYKNDGKIVEYNQKLLEILNANHEELNNLNVFEVITDKVVFNIFKESLERETNKYEGYYNSAISGRKFFLRLNIKRVTNDNGDVLGAVAMLEDITKTIEAKAKLEVSEANFSNVLNNIGDMIVVITEGKPVYVNPELIKLSGYTKEELLTKEFTDFIHPEDILLLKKNYLSRLRGRPLADNYVTRAFTKSGEVRSIELKISELPFNSTSTIVVVLRDITQKLKMEKELREAKEKAEESDRVKSTFLATMSHELRTPLNHVIGFSNLLEEEDINECAKAYSKLIYRSSRRLLSIIEDIFTVVGLEQGAPSVYFEETTIFELFNNNKKQLQRILCFNKKEDVIRLRFRPNPQYMDESLKIDTHKVDLILKNLFSNAVKFTNEGYVEFGYYIAENRELIFYVSDTGVGIPNDKKDIIFESFRQVDEKLNKPHGGMGLGLSISKKIADSINADIYYENNSNGIGTSFYLSIQL